MRTFGLILLVSIALAAVPSPLAADAACEAQCWEEYDACVGPGCASYWHCAECDERRDQCFAACAAAPPCPTTRDYSTGQVLSASYYSSFRCMLGRGVFGGVWHQLTDRVVRIRDWRETTNCDGSKTTNLLNTYNRSERCWDQTYSACSPWVGPHPSIPTCFPW